VRRYVLFRQALTLSIVLAARFRPPSVSYTSVETWKCVASGRMILTGEDYLILTALLAACAFFCLAVRPRRRMAQPPKRMPVESQLELGAAGRAGEGDHVANVGHAGDELHRPLQSQTET